MLYIAIGILGATVMPHNLYLHSLDRADPEGAARRRVEAGGHHVCDARLDRGAAVRVLHQRGHPDPGRRHVPPDRPPGGSRHRRCVSAADAAARDHSGEHPVRRGAAGLGAELHHHRHAGRADRDGRVSQHPAAGVAPPAHHPSDRDRACGDRDRACTASEGPAAAHPEPGDSEPAALLRGGAAGVLHQPAPQDGQFVNVAAAGGRSRGRWPLVIMGLNVWLLVGTFASGSRDPAAPC